MTAACSSCSSVDPQQMALQYQLNIAVIKKQLDAQQAQGAAVQQLLAAAAQFGRAVGRGEQFDGVA